MFDYLEPATLILGILSALLLHECALRRVEIDHLTLPIIVASFVIYGTLVYYISFASATIVAASFWIPLWLYIATYRAFFHPLRSYPGPFAARLSMWWTVWQNYRTDLHFHRLQQMLQRQYGDYVRTGPRELTIFDVEAIPTILGAQSRTTKGPMYDIMERSLHMNRDKQWHRQRRRLWDNAFKTTLSDFAPKVEHFTTQLVDRLQDTGGKPVVLLDLMNYYAYDVMAELAFGKPMGFIVGESSDIAKSIVKTMRGGLYTFGLLHHMPWFLKALALATSGAGPLKEWANWSASQMKTRMAAQNPKPDLISILMDNTSKDEAGRQLMYGESRLIVSAGSETLSTALTFIFMHLATNTQYVEALRKEVRENAADFNCQRSLPLLEAIINESMRRWPSIYHASSRITPPEGLTINGHFVPGNMIVKIPPFALYRDPRYFVKPDEFLPERWLDKESLVISKEAYIPFSTGPYNCAGKGLAMMELRSVVARVVSEFDIMLPKDFVEEEYWESIKDHFTAGPPEQMVRFVKVAA